MGWFLWFLINSKTKTFFMFRCLSRPIGCHRGCSGRYTTGSAKTLGTNMEWRVITLEGCRWSVLLKEQNVVAIFQRLRTHPRQRAEIMHRPRHDSRSHYGIMNTNTSLHSNLKFKYVWKVQMPAFGARICCHCRWLQARVCLLN